MADLGNKFDCFKCHTKFYDLRRPDPVCPKCGANQKEAKASDLGGSTHSARPSRRAVAPVAPPPPDPDLGEFEEAGPAAVEDDEEEGLVFKEVDEDEEEEEDEDE